MATLRRNIIANLAGGGWIAALTLIITPIQINLLGMEAYGLIGFITMLQIILSVLDLGLSSTVTRELAGDNSISRQASRPLLQTAITFYWGMALFICVALFLSAESIGYTWFNAETVDYTDITYGLQVVAVMLALRLPVALYVGALTGIQRMDILNLIKVVVTTIRLLGGVAIILATKNLGDFLVWTMISAFAEVFLYAVICRKLMPEMDWYPGFSINAVKKVWGFSLSMNGLALLGVGITQIDRLMISKMLTLESLGYYSLAYNSATAISLVLTALSSALMPSYASAHASKSREILLCRYDNANRITLFLTGIVLFPFLFFGESILLMWVNFDAAAGAWLSLALLAVGFWFSAAVSNAYNISVACRQPGPMLKISVLSAIIYVPALYFLILAYGIEGAAIAWLLLNMGYVLVIIPIVHRYIIHIPIKTWFVNILFPFAVLGITVFWTFRLLSDYFMLAQKYELFMVIPAIIFYIVIGYFLLGKVICADILSTYHRLVKGYKSP